MVTAAEGLRFITKNRPSKTQDCHHHKTRWELFHCVPNVDWSVIIEYCYFKKI